MRDSIALGLQMDQAFDLFSLGIQASSKESCTVFEGRHCHVDVAFADADDKGADTSGISQEVANARGRRPALAIGGTSVKRDGRIAKRIQETLSEQHLPHLYLLFGEVDALVLALRGRSWPHRYADGVFVLLVCTV